MELWELAAREQIRDLIARYAHCADGGRFREMVGLFSEDGVLDIDGRAPLHGHAAIESFLESARETISGRLRRPYLRHHVNSIDIDVDDPGRAGAASYFLVITECGLDHWGRYRDRFVYVGERWYFAGRRVRVDGRTADGQAPVDTPDFENL